MLQLQLDFQHFVPASVTQNLQLAQSVVPKRHLVLLLAILMAPPPPSCLTSSAAGHPLWSTASPSASHASAVAAATSAVGGATLPAGQSAVAIWAATNTAASRCRL